MAVLDDEWPTTQRVSRRTGETLHDAEYAAAIEGPCEEGHLGFGSAVAIVAASALLGMATRLLWQLV